MRSANTGMASLVATYNTSNRCTSATGNTTTSLEYFFWDGGEAVPKGGLTRVGVRARIRCQPALYKFSPAGDSSMLCQDRRLPGRLDARPLKVEGRRRWGSTGIDGERDWDRECYGGEERGIPGDMWVLAVSSSTSATIVAKPPLKPSRGVI